MLPLARSRPPGFVHNIPIGPKSKFSRRCVVPSSSEPTELFLLFAERFEQLGLKYMVSGSIAAIVYGEPRLTHDIDLVVAIARDDAAEIERAFPEEEFYCPPSETMEIEARRAQRGHFNLIHQATGFKADVYLAGRDPIQAWGFANRRKLDVGGQEIWVAAPEYVILFKLEYYREGGSPKHLDDIRGILRLTPIDEAELSEKIDARGLRVEWTEAQSTR